MEIAYYTCLNDECFKYRGIFTEGNAQHANCERARLYLQGEQGLPGWTWLAVPAMVAIAAGVVALALVRKRRAQEQRPPSSERQTETWSGNEHMRSERRGHDVPPPIARETML